MFILSGTTIIFFILYQKRLMRHQRRLQEIQTEHQMGLLYSNINTLEKERKRFSEDLHDELGSQLSALRLYVCQVEREEPMSPSGLAIINESKALVDTAINSVRRISYDLLPPGIESFGLQYTVEDLFQRISSLSGLEVNIDMDIREQRFDNRTELALYRVIQELVNNTLKHSGAIRICLGIQVKDQKLHLQYSDDGKGFDKNGLYRPGLGMQNIDTRIGMIGGAIRYATGPGKGFNAEIEVPI